jgi:hypothetical protein
VKYYNGFCYQNKKGYIEHKIAAIVIITMIIFFSLLVIALDNTIGNVGITPLNYTFPGGANRNSHFILEIWINNSLGYPLKGAQITLSGYNINLVLYTNSTGYVSFPVYYYSTPNTYIYTLNVNIEYQWLIPSYKNIQITIVDTS